MVSERSQTQKSTFVQIHLNESLQNLNYKGRNQVVGYPWLEWREEINYREKQGNWGWWTYAFFLFMVMITWFYTFVKTQNCPIPAFWAPRWTMSWNTEWWTCLGILWLGLEENPPHKELTILIEKKGQNMSSIIINN